MKIRHGNMGYALVVGLALTVGLAVSALVSAAVESTVGAPGDVEGVAAILLPAIAGLVSVVAIIDAGLRRVRRSGAKAGW